MNTVAAFAALWISDIIGHAWCAFHAFVRPLSFAGPNIWPQIQKMFENCKYLFGHWTKSAHLDEKSKNVQEMMIFFSIAKIWSFWILFQFLS